MRERKKNKLITDVINNLLVTILKYLMSLCYPYVYNYDCVYIPIYPYNQIRACSIIVKYQYLIKAAGCQNAIYDCAYSHCC